MHMDLLVHLELDIMVDFTYGMTLECDLTGSQWIRWKSGFLCGLSGVIAAQMVT